MQEIGWLLFVERVVGSIAWPIAFVIAVVMFRREVGALLRRVNALKVSGAEFGFAELLDEAAKDAAHVQGLPAPGSMIDIDERTFAKHPHFAIIEAWRSIEILISSIIRKRSPEMSSRETTGSKAMTWLREHELVSSDILVLIDDLRVIRNKAVHEAEPAVTKGQAIEYITLSKRVETALKAAAGDEE